MPTHKTDSDGAIKKIKGQDESRKLLKKLYKKNPKKRHRFRSHYKRIK